MKDVLVMEEEEEVDEKNGRDEEKTVTKAYDMVIDIVHSTTCGHDMKKR